MIAFAVTSVNDPDTVKHDPHFVKWLAYQRIRMDGKETQREV